MLEVTIIAPTLEAGEHYRDNMLASRAEGIRATIATPSQGQRPIEGTRCHELHVLTGVPVGSGRAADLVCTAQENLRRTAPRPHPLSA